MDRIEREAVLREMADGVIVVDHENVCQLCNPAAARLLGLDREQIIGRPAEEWMPVTSANLDRRSFEINFEMGVLVYDAGFAGTLRVLQQGYMDRSAPVDAATWAQRPLGRRLLEGAAGLLSPLL